MAGAERTLLAKFEGKVDPSLSAAAGKTKTVLDQAADEVESSSKRHNESMMMLATGFGAAIGTIVGDALVRAKDAVVDFVKGSVDAASDLKESVGLTTMIFGDQAAAMDAFFKGSAKSIGMNEAAARQASGELGGALLNLGFTMDESAKWSEILLRTSADMGAAFNMSTNDAIVAIGSGIRGESEPLKKFNVFLTDAAVKAKALELGLYSGKGALDANAAAQARLALIMEGTSPVQGNFADTSRDNAGAQKVFAASLVDVQAKLGGMLLPVMKTWLNLMVDDGLPAIEGFVSWMGEAGEWIQLNASWLVPLVGGVGALGLAIAGLGLVGWIASLGGVSAALTLLGGKLAATTIATYAVQTAQLVARGGVIAWTAVQWLLNAALSANPIGLVILALAALGVGLKLAWDNSETFRAIVMGAWEGIQTAAKAVGDWFVNWLLPGLAGVWKGIETGFGGLVDWFSGWGRQVRDAISGPISWVATHVINPLLGGIEKVAGIFGLKWTLPRVPVPQAAGFADGGYTGPGGKWQPAGVVHAGEVVWSQEDVAAWGGPQAVDRMRLTRLSGFAGGGIVPNPRQGFRGYDPKALAAMQAWAAATGVTWHMTGNGGARSYADQKRAWDLYRAGRGPLAANPDRGGPHMYPAIAMDLSPRPGERPSARATLGQFGLGLTVPGEPWHVGWLGGRGGGMTSGGGMFDPIGMLRDMIKLPTLAGAGVFGELLNSMPGRLLAGAADEIKHALGFDSGGWLQPGATLAVNATGRPEAVLTAGQWDVVRQAVTGQSDLSRVVELLEELVRILGDAVLGNLTLVAEDSEQRQLLEDVVRLVRRQRRAGVS